MGKGDFFLSNGLIILQLYYNLSTVSEIWHTKSKENVVFQLCFSNNITSSSLKGFSSVVSARYSTKEIHNDVTNFLKNTII